MWGLCMEPSFFLFTLFFYPNVHGAPTIDSDVDTLKEHTRYNFCELEKEINKNRLPLKHAIRGLNVTVGLTNYYVNETNKTKVLLDERNKLPVTLMNAISERAGFYWQDNIYLMSNPKIGETWTEVLLRDVKKVDLVGDWYLLTVDRLTQSIHVAESWYDGSLIMIMGENNEKAISKVEGHKGWLAKPFSLSAWIFIWITLVVTAFVFHFIDFFESTTRQKEMDHSLSDNLFFGLMTSTGHFLYQPTKTGTRILSFSVAATTVIVYSLYTANLANYLVEDMTVVITVTDINDAIDRGMGICYDGQMNTGIDYIRNYYPSANLTETANLMECFGAVSNGNCDICITYKSSWDIYKDDLAYNPHCDLLWVGKPIRFYKGGFMLQKSTELCNRVIEDVMTIYIKEMKEDGYFETLWNTYLEQLKSNCKKIPPTTVTAEGYTFELEDVIGIFIFHTISVIIAIAIGVFQYCRKPKEERREISAEFYSGVTKKSALTSRASRFVRRRLSLEENDSDESEEDNVSESELQHYNIHERDDDNHHQLSSSPLKSPNEEENKNSIENDNLSPELCKLRDACQRITNIVDGFEAAKLRRRRQRVTFK